MNTRKVLSLALALVLTLGLAAPAMAAGTPDIPVPGAQNAFSSEKCIRTEPYSHDNYPNAKELLVYPEGTTFRHQSAASNDRYSEVDDPKGASGSASYGSTFQLPKTDTIFRVIFDDYMTPGGGTVFIKLEGKEAPAQPAPSAAPGEPNEAVTTPKEKYYVRGAEMMGTIDTELLGTSETKPEDLSWIPFTNLVPAGTTVSGEFGAHYEVNAIYHGDSMQKFTAEEYTALMGAEMAKTPFTVTTEDYYLIMPQEDEGFFGGVLVKGVTEGKTPPADSTSAAAEEIDFTATPSTKTVKVDGKPVEFQFYSVKNYLGVVTDYVKLRDVASVLNGTSAQFNVIWDGAVNLVPGETYVPNGSEMQPPFSGERTYSFPATETKVAGRPADLDAIVLCDDQGGGFTYYPLPLLGLALGFEGGLDVVEGWVIRSK